MLGDSLCSDNWTIRQWCYGDRGGRPYSQESLLKDLEMQCYLQMIQKEPKMFECVYVNPCGKYYQVVNLSEGNKNIY